MKGKRHTAEQIIAILREAEIAIGSGQSIGQFCQKHRISDQTYYRWKNEYGGMATDQLKRLKELESRTFA